MTSSPRPGTHLESQIFQDGGGPVCGVDEAGRGPLAGPVVAAAVILPLKMEVPVPYGPEDGVAPPVSVCRVPDRLVGINDSKKLSAKGRLHYAHAIREIALGIGVGMASPREIERLNIRQATLLAMFRALGGLVLDPHTMVLVDGRDLPDGLVCPARAIIRGDQMSVSIAAASIIAKEVRDARMAALAKRCPGYGWERNRGYPTAEHLRALRTLGVTEHHRRSFAPVQKVCQAVALDLAHGPVGHAVS